MEKKKKRNPWKMAPQAFKPLTTALLRDPCLPKSSAYGCLGDAAERASLRHLGFL